VNLSSLYKTTVPVSPIITPITTASGSFGIIDNSFYSDSVLNGHVAVVMCANGRLTAANPYDESCLGTVMGVVDAAYPEGVPVNVVRYGTMVSLDWTWIAGKPIFLGALGQLTQVLLPDAKFIQQIGMAKTSTVIVINIQQPVLRAI
jgi:hypothetical protein